MNRFLLSQIKYRRARTMGLGAGILVAAVSFVLLTSAVSTSALQVRGTVSKNFRPAYDILVRPRKSFTPLEQQRGVVRENYLSGIFGGITLRQYHEIKDIAGVQVAAPIANIGYILPFQTVRIRINKFLSRAPFQLYRLRPTWHANNGLSRYPDSNQYVYYTERDRFLPPKDVYSLPTEELPSGKRVKVCAGYGRAKSRHVGATGPFSRGYLSGIECFSKRGPVHQINATDAGPFAPGQVGNVTTAYFPIFLAAIDPVQEQKLIHFDQTITSGRALRETDGLRSIPTQAGLKVVPVLASTKTYVDEILRVAVERLHVPKGVDLPKRLASSKHTDRFVQSLPRRSVGHVEYPIHSIYEALVKHYSKGPSELKHDNNITYDGYFSTSPTKYKEISAKRLRALPVHNPVSTYQSYYYPPGWAPLENKDTNYRRLKNHHANSSGGYGATFNAVGRFDPTKLPGFSALSRVPLETYYPPRLEPADAASKKALGGGPLLPTQSLAGYIGQPPLMLTTLKAAKIFHDETYFSPAGPRKAPISVIRVRVASVTGPDPVSRERIRTIATAIHQRTGLSVDITAGSSPRPMLVQLAAGKFGQPPLLVREGWVQKGVAVRFLNALDKKSLALFLLVLVVCALFLVNAALASVRTRRTEIGTLLCLGWSQSKIFRAILSELLLIGLLAGAAGAFVSMAVVPLLSLEISVARALIVIPVAVVLATAAGIFPAWRAARADPLDALNPVVHAKDLARHTRGLVSMAARNLTRMPGRAVLAASGLVIGVSALTILVALNRAFQGTLVGTLLGNAISVQVRAVDFLAVALIVVLGGLSLTDVLFLNISERRAELVTLRTVGWKDHHLVRLMAVEGVGTGVIGSVLGALVGVGAASLIRGVPLSAIALGATIGTLAGVIVAVLGCLLPLSRISSLTPPAVLAEE